MLCSLRDKQRDPKCFKHGQAKVVAVVTYGVAVLLGSPPPNNAAAADELHNAQNQCRDTKNDAK